MVISLKSLINTNYILVKRIQNMYSTFSESTKLFNNISTQILNLFERSFGGSPTDDVEQPQNSNTTEDRKHSTPLIRASTKASSIECTSRNLNTIEMNFECDPKIQRILSEKTIRKCSQRNVILTVNDLKVHCDLKCSKLQVNDKNCPISRRSSSV